MVIGGTSVAGGKANVPGIWGAALFLVLLLTMLNTIGVSAGGVTLGGAMPSVSISVKSRPRRKDTISGRRSRH